MKRIREALKKVMRSNADDEIERLHAESRAENARLIAGGRGWEGLKKNASLIGLAKDGSKPKMIFGAKRSGLRKRT